MKQKMLIVAVLAICLVGLVPAQAQEGVEGAPISFVYQVFAKDTTLKFEGVVSAANAEEAVYAAVELHPDVEFDDVIRISHIGTPILDSYRATIEVE